LHVRNGGDGPARRVQISIAQPSTLIYVPNSTTVNDVPVRDVGANAPFASERGIVLNEVDPGVEATIRWRDVVHNGLPAGEAILHIAHIRYDGDRDDEILSNELKVRATPVFANAIPGLPFGLDGMVGPSFGGANSTRALTEERFLELPPATPVGESNGAHPLAVTNYPALEHGKNGEALDAEIANGRVGTILSFTGERLARTVRFIDEARFGGLVTHIFALRAFFPDSVGDAHGGAVAALHDALREELDRLFIKLRLPNYTIAPRDIETPSLRATIERVVHDACIARGVPAESPAVSVVLRGSFEPEEMHELAERLGGAELAGALPWAALARLLPDATPQFENYRSVLIARLDALAQGDASEFIDALQRKSDPALDAALDVARASLNVHA
jgi:hypothetical protein